MARGGIATAVGGALAALALALAPATAAAKEAQVTAAEVELRLADDASLLVNERLRFDYDGDFQASYREIDLNFGERIRDVAVSEPGGPRYRPGGCANLGCFDPFPNRFGTAQIRAACASSGITTPPTSSGPSTSPTGSSTPSSPTTTCSTCSGRSGARSGTSGFLS